MSRDTKRLQRSVWPALFAMVVVVTLAAITWALRKGFDTSDEAWVYSLIQSNRITDGEVWGFQHLLHPIFSFTGESVLVFRVLRLLGYLVVSLVLVAVAKTVSGKLGIVLPRTAWVVVLSFAQVGTFLAFAYPPRYISYNELSSWLSQIGIAIMILLLAQRLPSTSPPAGQRWAWTLWTALGVILGLLVFAKVTSAVLFTGLGLIILLTPGTGLRLWQRLVGVMLGLASTVALCAMAGFPLATYVESVLTLALDREAQTALDHPVDELLEVYRLSLTETLTTLAPALILLIISSSLIALRISWMERGREWPSSLTGTVLLSAGLAMLTLFARPTPQSPFAELGTLAVFVGCAAVVTFATLPYRPRKDPLSRRRLGWTVGIGSLFVLSTPFIGAIGTNNPIAGQLIYASTMWAVVLGTGMMALHQQLRRGIMLRQVPLAILFSTLLLASLHVRGEIVEHPYRTAPYAQQGTQTTAPYLGSIRLTAAEASWADWMSNQSARLGADHAPTVALSSPGALLLFNNSSFTSPWIDSFWSISFDAIARSCAAGSPDTLFVIQPGSVAFDSPTAQGATAALDDACGIDFPADFTIASRYPSADSRLNTTIWRLHVTE